MTETKTGLFIQKLKDAVSLQAPVRMTIAKKRKKGEERNRVRITLIRINAGLRLSFVYQYPTRETTTNFGIDDGIAEIQRLLAHDFFNADLFTATETVQLVQNQKGNAGIKISKAVQQESDLPAHDHQKKYFIDPAGNIYLHELGITHSDGTLIKDRIAKFRQINKYIEVLDAEFRNLDLPDEAVILDMGSGKGYLTFALYDYLVNSLHQKIHLTGIEFRKELVDLCNSISQACNFSGLTFTEGSIASADITRADVLIALHACDTATDEAIWKGITAGAKLIVCAPCCHKQIRKEMNPVNELAPLMKHGILKEREAELLTDGIRALILEDHGYKTRVFEFISTEHTPKNLMITAVKKSVKPAGENAYAIHEIKRSFGIDQHYLEKLLGKNY